MSLLSFVSEYNWSVWQANKPQPEISDINHVAAQALFRQLDEYLSPSFLFAAALKSRYLNAFEELKRLGFQPDEEMRNV